ncbi:MAG: aminotransferase class III-fold pyridoxal phosphate-dependent enzyme [Gilvibacter sp.]
MSDINTLVFELFGLKAATQLLYGEKELNYHVITTDGNEFVLKLTPTSIAKNTLQTEQALLTELQQSPLGFTIPKPVADAKGALVSDFDSDLGSYYVRLLSWVPGRLWSGVNPHRETLLNDLGAKAAKLCQALALCKTAVKRPAFRWDTANALWTRDHLDLFDSSRQQLLKGFLSQFHAQQDSYKDLKKQLIHNDLNDNNILVSASLQNPTVNGFIDFGDVVYSQRINELANCCAYALMGHNDPLEAIIHVINGFNSQCDLDDAELHHLYVCIAMRLAISVTVSAINKKERPDNTYLQVSDAAAWDGLQKWSQINPEIAYYSFRAACDLPAHRNQKLFESWSKTQKFEFTELFPSTSFTKAHLLDLSVSSLWIGNEQEFNNLDLFSFKIEQLQKQVPEAIIAGGYLEPRPIYTDSAYDKIGNHGPESRRVHLGIDFWLPAFTPVHCLLDGTVVAAVNDAGPKEYGGMVILEHQLDALIFYTLYGHLSVDSALAHKKGDLILAGAKIGELGPYPENGNWAPHLHFEIMLSMLDYEIDFPGVAYPGQVNVWKSLCPDPNLLFKDKDLVTPSFNNKDQIKSERDTYLGTSMSLQYEEPLHIVRGQGVYLTDPMGTQYLDTVNNVAHVGHENHEVVKAGQSQMALLNTNTRYLHPTITKLAKQLTATMPDKLKVVHFVNSGSEANELALRMVQSVTGSKHMIASEVGYHGNTNACVSVSSYKFDGKGGAGAPETTHIFPLPDTFRGKYTGPDASAEYAKEVDNCIKIIQQKGQKLGGLILESILSCGGQIELPKGFLKEVYKTVRAAGGICIADEVQTGCGRMGKTFWGFQLHDVVPDIVTIGKPLGNGHPIAAVVCTREVALKFANGMEYFNTFGGNPVSCAIGSAVLEVIEDQNLQENAKEVGAYLKDKLTALSKRFPIIADVRGQGLFLGIELCDTQKLPLAAQATYLVNRMKDFKILMSTDGPDHNVIKIKPPVVFSIQNGQQVLRYLEIVLKEDFMQIA